MLSILDDNAANDFLKKYLLVDISDATYAFKIEYVKEIIPIIDMFTINTMDNNITGLINLRGKTIPVYDLRGFLGKDLFPITIHHKFLILNVEETTFAIIIDAVGEIIDIDDENISVFSCSDNADYIKTTVLKDETIIIIEPPEFLIYAKTSDNVKKISSYNLMLTEKSSAEKVKNRLELLNEQNNYVLTEEEILNERFIIFKLETEIYAFNISCIKEIKQIPQKMINKVPCVPDFIIGILNFRGDYVSVLNIKSFLNIISSEMKKRLNVIFLKVNELKLAIIVDEILDINHLNISDINQTQNNENSFVIGDLLYEENKMVNILNVEKLFSAENINIENYV